MTKERAKELVPILQAFSEDKIIQQQSIGSGSWYDQVTPNFSDNQNYRIKLEPKLVPFTFEDHLLFKNKWIKKKGMKSLKQIISVFLNSVIVFDLDKFKEMETLSIDFAHLLTDYEFEHGGSCGKLITV